MKTADEVFARPFGAPGSAKNSKTSSSTHSEKRVQVGGNMLSGAWHPQLTVPKNREEIPTYTARPTQHRDATRGVTGSVGQFVPFNNTNTRPLAGSPQSGTHFRAFRGANTLRNQHQSRTTARDITGVDTTTRRGGSSIQHFARPVAGTTSTYAVPSNVAGGRGNVEFVNVKAVHNIGLHKIVVSNVVPTSKTRTRGKVA